MEVDRQFWDPNDFIYGAEDTFGERLTPSMGLNVKDLKLMFCNRASHASDVRSKNSYCSWRARPNANLDGRSPNVGTDEWPSMLYGILSALRLL